MKSFSIYFVLLILGVMHQCPANAQQAVKKYVKENTKSIKTIDPTLDNFEDLAPISAAIGEAQIVLMGEMDHGDATTFSAKSRLVKFLHEKHGFNVLALETDFFSLNQGWAITPKTPDKIVPYIKNNVLRLWADCYSYNYLLYEYIPASFGTSSPLHITGFDNQMVYQYARTNLLTSIDTLIESYHLPIGKEPAYRTVIRPVFDSLIHNRWYKTAFNSSAGKKDADICNYWLGILRQEALLKLDSNDFRIRVIENLISHNRLLAKAGNYKQMNEIRDAQMAANLHWLITYKYPQKKIIVWAASLHTQKREKEPFATMGYVLAQKLDSNIVTYSLGFTAHSGKSGRLGQKPYNIAEPSPASMENWIDPVYDFAFVDYKNYNNKNPGKPPEFRQRDCFYRERTRPWTSVFDGMFFIRRMEACGQRSGFTFRPASAYL